MAIHRASIELGLATGLRSMVAIARLSHELPASVDERDGTVARFLARPGVRSLTRALAVGEMVADKLPGIPDRVAPGPLAARVVNGAIAGRLVARHNGESPLAGTLAGALGAFVAARLGYGVRRVLTHCAGLNDFPVALCEDLLAVTLARHALPGRVVHRRPQSAGRRVQSSSAATISRTPGQPSAL